jgi:hypothetical protein
VRRSFGLMASWFVAAWNARRLAVCFWPGLPQLWIDGSWRGLGFAIAFGALFNALVATSLVWHELSSTTTKSVGWVAVIGVWFASAIVSWRSLDRSEGQEKGESAGATTEDLYPAAINEYLKRNFVAAERLARRLIKQNDRDIPAGLLLASVWRRTGHTVDAQRELGRLARLEASEPWTLEIERELARLTKAEKSTKDSQPHEANSDKPDEINQAA